MSKITVVLAGDKNYKAYVEKGKQTTEALGYTVSVYDLGGLGFGTPFTGRVTDEPNAKIPCKPRIILEELKNQRRRLCCVVRCRCNNSTTYRRNQR